ncbi:MAG: hypothetical protein ACR2JI_16785 [Mycobacterium sp.]
MRNLVSGCGVATALIAAAGVAGCATPTRVPEPPPSATSSRVPTATPAPAGTPQSARIAKWIDLAPGDCLAAPPPTDPAVVTVTVVDCAAPHLAEAYLRANIPVDAALSETANAQCSAGLTRYTGLAAGSSPYAVTYLIDSDQDRTSNNPYPSTIICLLQDATGQSLAGSAKY